MPVAAVDKAQLIKEVQMLNDFVHGLKPEAKIHFLPMGEDPKPKWEYFPFIWRGQQMWLEDRGVHGKRGQLPKSSA